MRRETGEREQGWLPRLGDRRVLRAVRGAAMAVAFELARPYVDARRVATGDDDRYHHLETAAIRPRHPAEAST